MYTVKRCFNKGMIRMGLHWMVEMTTFDGETTRTLGFFSQKHQADEVALAMNATAVVMLTDAA